MKKLISILLVAVLLSVPVYADDYSSMTIEELVELRNEIDREINSRIAGDSGQIGEGIYQVGKDFKAGSYIYLFPGTGDSIHSAISLYKDEEAFNNNAAFMYSNLHANETATVNVSDGNFIRIEYGGGIISRNTNFWAVTED